MERFIHIILGFVLAFCCIEAEAQNTMRVSQKDGTVIDIPIENVNSITFVNVEEPEGKASICGTWKWVGLEEGYSETLTFNADGTFTCVDNSLPMALTAKPMGRICSSVPCSTYEAMDMVIIVTINGWLRN